MLSYVHYFTRVKDKKMYKHKDYLVEFSNIYKRLMELEICLKNKIYNSIVTTYPDACYKKFQPFFSKNEIYNKYTEYKSNNKIYKLIEIQNNIKLANNQKLYDSLYNLYLNDILKLLVFERVYYKDNNLT